MSNAARRRVFSTSSARPSPASTEGNSGTSVDLSNLSVQNAAHDPLDLLDELVSQVGGGRTPRRAGVGDLPASVCLTTGHLEVWN